MVGGFGIATHCGQGRYLDMVYVANTTNSPVPTHNWLATGLPTCERGFRGGISDVCKTDTDGGVNRYLI